MTVFNFLMAFLSVAGLVICPIVLVLAIKWSLGQGRRLVKDKEQFYKVF